MRLITLLLISFFAHAAAAQDAYEQYVTTSKDFARVAQDEAKLLEAWPGWIYMPWTYQWPIGYDEASAKWSIGHGYNGAFLDHGRVDVDGVNKLDWIDRFSLKFYMDHTAGKGDLHLWDSAEPYLPKIHATGVRTVPLDEALKKRLKDLIKKNIENVKASPNRAAYALDDEVSWGSFVTPCMWRLNDDREAYDQWLTEIYGSEEKPEHPGWISYETIRPKLSRWSIKEFDASQLMDQWTYNDARWCNLLGELVEHANRIDPETPCGIVGAQAPSPFGGYDYARLMRKVQFIEAYDLGGSQALIRSFNPRNALPAVTTDFFRSADKSIWSVWYYLAHGNRGYIGWVERWFDEKTGKPLPWHEKTAPHYLEAGHKIGPLLAGAQWMHDGVALYYSHASIQLGWILDAEAHGATWKRRNNDHLLGASHNVRRAWENMLRDEGLQYDFLGYIDVIREGIPPEYKVLILPATLCLSDVEARRIRAFCEKGGTVIADYLPGLWDQHGRGRKTGGALDDLFGAHHDPGLKARDLFHDRLWTEVDQEKHYSSFPPPGNDHFSKVVSGMETERVNRFGKGKAVLMNQSPQFYITSRHKRDTFMKHVGIKRWVEGEMDGHEITYWRKGDRTIVFLVLNQEKIDSRRVPVRLKFARPIKEARNERTGEDLGDGQSFLFQWKLNEAVVISFAGGS